MRTRVFMCVIACACVFLNLFVYGQSSPDRSPGHSKPATEEKDPVAILEIGAATSWNVMGGAATFAPNFAVETTPIENWLEIEGAGTPLFPRHSTECDTDRLCKKPWKLSRTAEFMLGVGPEWVHLRQNATIRNSISGELAGDF